MEPNEGIKLLRQLPTCLLFKPIGDPEFDVSTAFARQFGEIAVTNAFLQSLRFYDPITKEELTGSQHPFSIAEETLHLCQWVRIQTREQGIQFFLESSVVTFNDVSWVVINAKAVQNNLFIPPEESSPVGKHIAFNGLLATLSSQLINAANDKVDDLIDGVLGAFGEFCDLDRCYLFKFYDNAQFATNTHEWVAAGVLPYKDDLQALPMDTMPYLDRKLKQEGLFKVNNVAYLPTEAKGEREEFERERICSILCVSIELDNGIFGFIGCDITGIPYTWRDHDIKYLQRIAQMLANTLQNAHNERALHDAQQQLINANSKLAKLANIDGLTGIANRRLFDNTLQADIDKSLTSNTPLSLLLIDVDNFKAYNDYYGHVAGDSALIQVAEILKKTCVGNDDVVARYGGEEFVVILPYTDTDTAIQVAERIRKSIEQAAIPFELSSYGKRLTISLGVSTMLHCHPISPNELIERADTALYLAKSLGRNRVDVWEPAKPLETDVNT
ncbi:diguanylate cyclase [Alteromonas sp. 1_MG-2023]|uniref:sensor domain-containing diguanylate cyclase n=1 Tax=Alteromonas sp. 1_MG-2023 TaxID=3062669 RepID=UPI0026E47A38|nr:diguanylate cyclase [Alteromonas sp. 1_MG-2023]MDO6566108.1 diguanylate cyclase [Alteromonas sp. 1_MG-2023]